MIGKLIGAATGAALSKETRKIGGTGGALLGALAVPLVTRLRIPTLLALAGGGYLAKKLSERGDLARDPVAPRANV
ncbi:MAG: hypothetical protein WBA68_08060 [Alteraurantiacibacter sp.]